MKKTLYIILSLIFIIFLQNAAGDQRSMQGKITAATYFIIISFIMENCNFNLTKIL